MKKHPRTLALNAIPSRWEEVTSEWMTDAVAHHHPGARVGEVIVVGSDEGNNRRARFQLRYEAGSGPEFLFAKAECDRFREMHASHGNLFNEPELFASGAPIPVAHPRPYKVLIDREALRYIVVMEDIMLRGAIPLNAEATLTIEQAIDGVRGMARYHGAYWNLTPASHPHLSWLNDWAPREGGMETIEPSADQGKKKTVGQMPPELDGYDTSTLMSLMMRALVSFTHGHQTLLHGDAHIGNCFLLPGDEVGLLDWQVARRGNWSQDLGYFFVSALSIEDRRAHEEELLRIYIDGLGLPADRLPSFDEVHARYAASMAYAVPIWLATYNAVVTQSPAGSLRLCQRYAQAFIDLDTQGALDRLGS